MQSTTSVLPARAEITGASWRGAVQAPVLRVTGRSGLKLLGSSKENTWAPRRAAARRASSNHGAALAFPEDRDGVALLHRAAAQHRIGGGQPLGLDGFLQHAWGASVSDHNT
ncbi:hypothetical protein [Ramlibacter sp.]|uniref:hypothetical protein n=1 Tax=Ramlibacter sp. TaxID=1917967 RepID=UPI0026123A3F|nr:hypothetical protein [Ramlibacter sp.]